MDLYQLKTFVTVAREGSITRASERLHLSQPAVSAHIKALEDALGLALFARTARGMTLTTEGERLLEKATQTLAAHDAMMMEAARIKGGLAGTLRIGAGASTSPSITSGLVARLASAAPGVQVALVHGRSAEILAALRDGSLDAGFYNEPGESDTTLGTVEVATFRICVVAGKGRVMTLDWKALAALPWIYPGASACCARTAERLFAAHGFRPRQVLSVDREDVTRSLVAEGVGVGLLHEAAAATAREAGELDVLHVIPMPVRVLFAYPAQRARDPLLVAASTIMRELASP